MRHLQSRPVAAIWLVLAMSGFVFMACDELERPPEPAESRTVSGRVLDMGVTPVAGATVELVSTDVDITDPDYRRRCDCPGGPCPLSTTSDEEGRWILPDVPLTYNPDTHQPYDLLLKVTAPRYPPAYNVYTLALGDQYDLMVLHRFLYFLFGLEALLSGADPAELSVVLGAAIGFSDMEYPQQTETIAGVTALARAGSPAEELSITYLGELGPDPGLTETSSLGAFYFVVPDATDSAMPAIDLTGAAPGRSMVGGYFPACPGGFTPAGLIDPYYRP